MKPALVLPLLLAACHAYVHGEKKMMEDPNKSVLIHDQGVGPINLGMALGNTVAARLSASELSARYRAGYFADARPWEGFLLEEPPVVIMLNHGPFTRLAEEEGYVVPDTKALAPAAAAAPVAAVAMIRVTDPRPRTAEGAGVGSSLADLSRAYPKISVHAVPPSFGKDECVATTPSLPRVHFYFESCDHAKNGGRVVEVLVFE